MTTESRRLLFPRELSGSGFRLVLVRADLDLPFEAFDRFRRGAWADNASKQSPRIYQAGLQKELSLAPENCGWITVQSGGDEAAALYAVLAETTEVVGLLRLVREATSIRYANVLYRRNQHRGSVSPDVVLLALLEFFKSVHVTHITTGNVHGPTFSEHVARCGFVMLDGGWVRSL